MQQPLVLRNRCLVALEQVRWQRKALRVEARRRKLRQQPVDPTVLQLGLWRHAENRRLAALCPPLKCSPRNSAMAHATAFDSGGLPLRGARSGGIASFMRQITSSASSRSAAVGRSGVDPPASEVELPVSGGGREAIQRKQLSARPRPLRAIKTGRAERRSDSCHLG